jgi:hypothetical protein
MPVLFREVFQNEFRMILDISEMLSLAGKQSVAGERFAAGVDDRSMVNAGTHHRCEHRGGAIGIAAKVNPSTIAKLLPVRVCD